MSTDAGMHRMIKKSLDQGCREINKLSMKLFISIIFNIIYLTTFKLAGCHSKYLKENIQFLLLNHTTVMEIGFIRLVCLNEFSERLALL
jgi:hypothetical protein